MPRVVDGKFRLLEPRASTDADSVCFLAEHMGIRRQVELKTLAAGVEFPGPAADRLFREARATGSVSHAGIQSVVDSGSDAEGRPYVVYEALKGQSITELCAESPAGVPAIQAARIVLSTLEAIRALHKSGVVARALGPDDVVVLGTKGDDEPIKLRALRAAAFLAEEPPPGAIPMGPWTAPEIRRGSNGVDPRVDVFSAGVMLRQLLTGRAHTERPLPDTARRAVDRATAESPDERFPDVEVLMQAVSLMTPSDARPPRDEMQTPEDPLAADLHYMSLRRSTRHGPRTAARGQAKVHLLPVLLTIEAIYRRLGKDAWARLAAEVPGVDDLLPGSGKTEVHMTTGVRVDLFARILASADAIAGHGDLGLLTEIGEAVAHRGLARLFPDLPTALTPEALVDGFPYVWSRITMQGTPVPLERNAASARLAVRGQVEPSLELSGFVAGLLRAAIRNTGVRHSEVFLTASQALGDAVDIYGVSWSR
jgi:serine/threonine-protein kinase